MAKKEDKKGGTIRIEYYKSVIGYPEKQKLMVRGLGFSKLNQIKEKPDNASMRGVVEKIPHILRIVE
ncbi:MAG: 50S ribosomal protein L30 [Acidobacteria bacterium]|nr:MAG: 50S ribosomal protein L30 [Acidobacteriota bacterium]REK02527.1 MAG: 50S ribosomal protein L30 [Acidobacteriota bacterium]REK13670.1 MAG: 50S ribosomal protein L30 [Acidobacteriota bacterium]REK41664.1 MAG: 50S ribosomal protein L30 [Acidobacteriota bacterium]